LASEEAAVYEDQNRFRERAREKREEAAKYARHKFETDRYRRHVAQGEQLSSPAHSPFIQPLAFAAMGPLVGAAYAGTQTGAMVGTPTTHAPGARQPTVSRRRLNWVLLLR